MIQIIDQKDLPFRFTIEDFYSIYDVVKAIEEMYVGGVGLIGVTAAYGMDIATLEAPKNNFSINIFIEQEKN